jgi:hypothetical protein
MEFMEVRCAVDVDLNDFMSLDTGDNQWSITFDDGGGSDTD